MGRTRFVKGVGPSAASLEKLRAQTAAARLDAIDSGTVMSLARIGIEEAVTAKTLRDLADDLPIRQQPKGDPRCVAYAFASAMDLSVLAETGVDPNLHDRFSVDHAWAVMKKKPAIMRGVDAARDGVTDESCWPHGASGGCADIGAQRFRATVEQPVVKKPQDLVPLLCDAIDRRVPLVTAVPIFTNFPSFTGGALYRAKGSVIGAHALVIVGYEEDATGAGGCWVALNSWGDGWGDGGLARLAWNDVDLRPEATLFTVTNVIEA